MKLLKSVRQARLAKEPLHKPRLLVLAAVVGLAGLSGCKQSRSVIADTLDAYVETLRAYDLSEIDGQPPQRPLRFYIGDNSRFATCARCLCVTGIMTEEYPSLGIRPTSGSPTFACERESAEFEEDARIASQFLSMTQATVSGGTVVFRSEDSSEMTFQLGGEDLSPP